jgi:hypothetical protein
LIEARTESESPADQYASFGSQRFEYNDLVKKHGELVARKTFDFLNTWRKNYQRAVYIETDSRASSNYEAMAQEMAGLFHWRYEKIKGSHELIQKLIAADMPNSEILFVPQGYATVFDPIRMSLDARPVTNRAGKEDNITTLDDDTPADESKGYIKVGLGIDAGGPIPMLSYMILKRILQSARQRHLPPGGILLSVSGMRWRGLIKPASIKLSWWPSLPPLPQMPLLKMRGRRWASSLCRHTGTM